MLLKATKLMSDVNGFFRSYMRGSHSTAKYVADPALRLLLSQINAFRLGCPAHMRRPTQAAPEMFDVDLITAHMQTHAATFTLGEPLVDAQTWKSDIANMALSAVRANLSLLYDSESFQLRGWALG